MTDVESIRVGVDMLVQLMQDVVGELRNDIVRIELILMLVCILLGSYFVFEFLKALRIRK